MIETNYNITAVIPAYSDISIVNNSILSLCTQWIPDNTFQLEIIIVNDNPDKGNQYDFYLSETFKKIIKPNIEIRIITNLVNSGQGVSRNVGIDNAKYNWIVLCDEDDVYTINAIYRIWEVLKKEHNSGEDNKPVSIIACPIYSFDENHYEHIINSQSIWVNAKLYNKQFLNKYNIRFPEGDNSHKAEDYPFSKMVEYAAKHDSSYKRIDFKEDEQTFYLWYPNHQSRSRCDKYYGSKLAAYTMQASVKIYDFMKNFNEKYLSEDKKAEEDEILKHEILNMNIYAFYNFLWFMKDLSEGWEGCTVHDWDTLRHALTTLRNKLLYYWREIVPSDVSDMLYRVKHHSDVRFIESWIGSFEDYINKTSDLLMLSFDKLKEYCKNLQFDNCNHEIHTSYVKAWNLRHFVD